MVTCGPGAKAGGHTSTCATATAGRVSRFSSRARRAAAPRGARSARGPRRPAPGAYLKSMPATVWAKRDRAAFILQRAKAQRLARRTRVHGGTRRLLLPRRRYASGARAFSASVVRALPRGARHGLGLCHRSWPHASCRQKKELAANSKRPDSTSPEPVPAPIRGLRCARTILIFEAGRVLLWLMSYGFLPPRCGMNFDKQDLL